MSSIKLNNVTVAYPAPVSNRQKSALAAAANLASFGRFAQDARGVPYVIALDSISLDLKQGSRVGIVGRNGSGKSTLLRTMAGIITPRSGAVTVTGRIGCVMNAYVGMNADASGLENMRMVGHIYGLRGPALDRAIKEAAEFTELGPFLHMPMRTYSAGMAARVGFAMATAEGADVLLIDEVIGAGDQHFIGKAVQRTIQMAERSGVCVLASHGSDIMRAFCDQAIWLDGGTVKAHGPVDEVLRAYDASETEAA